MKRNTLKKSAAVLVAAAVLASAPIAAYSARTELSVSSGTLSKGDQMNLDVRGAKESTGSYKSSDKKVASVTKKGVVKAKKTGTATITWRKGSQRLNCTVKVVKAPVLSASSLRIKEGESGRITVSRYGNPSLKVTWTSSDQTIATVQSGTITGVSQGTAAVTARIRGNKKQWNRRISVTVEQAGTPGDAEQPADTDKEEPVGTDPVVYMTTDISPEGLMKAYQALEWQPSGKTAVKLSTGEPPASNYLEPSLIGDLVKSVNGTIVECNTAYGGQRSSTAMHMQVAKDHGFTEIADVDILDEDGSMSLPVNGGAQLQENYVGSHFADYDSYLVLSHFKGHAMAGFGGAIKNISIGLGSKEGKCWIHTAGSSRTSPWGGNQDAFLESMGEAGKAVSDYLGNGQRIVYVNVMNRISIDCDCDGNPSEPDLHDIGILASADPVALDQACIDLVYEQKDGDGASLVNRIESRNGLHTLEHAQQIGLGSRTYRLVGLDG